MFNSKKELYSHLADNFGIYLPIYQLDLLFEDMKKRAKKESIFSILYSIENDPHLKKYNKKINGAYTDHKRRDAFLKKVSVKVAQYDKDTNKLIAVHSSLYSACQAIGKKNGWGNISKSIRRGTLAYDFKWKEIK